ncbi:Unknown protein [Striga hermonthica]|uniref:Uncharacterized protein n=1 Tax=Striga hermonthica TaxID=68872 RepID=A0A9N7RA17_STRHE|nr:Unknown protein [Striga hermonthica]
MTQNLASAFFLVSLLFAASNPPASAQILPDSVDLLNVAGQLCCTSNGNCPGQGVSGALVSLNSKIHDQTTALAQATTNSNGSFDMKIVKNLLRLIANARREVRVSSLTSPNLSAPRRVRLHAAADEFLAPRCALLPRRAIASRRDAPLLPRRTTSTRSTEAIFSCVTPRRSRSAAHVLFYTGPSY